VIAAALTLLLSAGAHAYYDSVNILDELERSRAGRGINFASSTGSGSYTDLDVTSLFVWQHLRRPQRHDTKGHRRSEIG
jgi:hypothetical protein